MKTDTQVALPLIGILVVAVVGLVFYLASYIFGFYGLGASFWIYLALVLVPVCFIGLFDFARAPAKED